MAIDYKAQLRRFAERRERMHKLRAQGRTVEQIAKALGISKQRVSQVLNGGAK